MYKMIRLLVHLCIMILPACEFKNKLLKSFFGWDISDNVKIGMSIILVKNVRIERDVTIKNFNIFKGFDNLIIKNNVLIHNSNRFETNPTHSWDSELNIGCFTTITNHHHFDLTDSILIGENVVIGGNGSRFWTHGFDVLRNRIQGAISIGKNVYIGSNCSLSFGVQIGDESIIGLGSVVTKSFPDGKVFIGGNPARIIHTNVVLEENNKNKLWKVIGVNKYFKRMY